MKVSINIGFVTLVGPDNKLPHKFGNCFSLIDGEGKEHRVVNFLYENLIECQKRFNLTDINVEVLPKSENIWIIKDERITKEWYNEKYCTVCTPIRMLPFEQRKEYLKDKKIKKCGEFLLISSEIKNTGRKLKNNWKIEEEQEIVYASYIPKLKNDN